MCYFGSTYILRSQARPFTFGLKFNNTIHGGINYSANKNRDYVYNATRPHAAKSGDTPRNILISGLAVGDGIVTQPTCEDQKDPNALIKIHTSVLVGYATALDATSSFAPESEDVSSQSAIKSAFAFPFNIASSSAPIQTGYNKRVSELFDEYSVISN